MDHLETFWWFPGMHWGGLNLFRQKIEEPAFSKLSGDGRWVVVRMKKNPCVISNLMYSGLVKWCHPRTGKMIIMFRLNTNTSTRALYKRKTTKPYQQQVYTNHFRVIKQKKLIDYPGIIHYTSLFAVGSPYKTTIPPFHWKKRSARTCNSDCFGTTERRCSSQP